MAGHWGYLEHLWVVEGYVWATTGCSCAELRRGEIDPLPQIFWNISEGAGDLPQPRCLNVHTEHTTVISRHKLTNKISLQHLSFGRTAVVREMGQ